MRTLTDTGTGADRSTLLVLLPPAMAGIDDLVQQGFVAAVRRRNVAADVILAEPTHEQVMQKTAAASLRAEVVEPALVRGYADIWLAGISLGAFNALHYAALFAGDLTGLSLVAPYPGTGDILREIEGAGGMAAWATAPGRSGTDERAWWHWLWRQSGAGAAAMPVYVGLGESDRFIGGQRMLADLVPPGRVDVVEGDHSWPVWYRLWERWLDRELLTGSEVAGVGR